MKAGARRSLLLLWAMATVLPACGGSGTSEFTVPNEIQSVWTATEDPYAGRSFEIDDRYVYFDIGDGNFDVHRIHVFEERQTEEGRFFHLEYRGVSGDRHSFDFFYVESEEGEATIRLQNRRFVRWYRANDDDVPWRIPGG